MKEPEFLQPLPPVPPPLPSVCFLDLEKKVSSFVSSKGQSIVVEEDELKVAVQSLLLSKKSLKDAFCFTNSSLQPQLQVGPKCGLVALSIATSMTKSLVNVKDIFELALAHGFTKQGEIFDASAIAILAEKFGFKAKVLDGGLKLYLCCILKSLLNKCLLLVPYDADFNHSPCCKKGSRAHWAVISGFVVMEEKSENEVDNNVVVINSSNYEAPADHQLHFSYYQGEIILTNKQKHNGKTLKNGKVYLVGLQGKSKHIGLWSFDDMALSNNNLISFPPARNPEMYVVPEGGIEKGLRGRAVLLEYPGVSFSTAK